jgi:hypothetical protein
VHAFKSILEARVGFKIASVFFRRAVLEFCHRSDAMTRTSNIFALRR